jgi:hypothetical protein
MWMQAIWHAVCVDMPVSPGVMMGVSWPHAFGTVFFQHACSACPNAEQALLPACMQMGFLLFGAACWQVGWTGLFFGTPFCGVE